MARPITRATTSTIPTGEKPFDIEAALEAMDAARQISPVGAGPQEIMVSSVLPPGYGSISIRESGETKFVWMGPLTALPLEFPPASKLWVSAGDYAKLKERIG
jgi:hypothetical protein